MQKADEEFIVKRMDIYGRKLFFTGLGDLGMNVTIRREMGSDIDAACGQLRNKK